jgi:phosphatidylglycerol---prolipoprotein diacylglyceryl transferase
MMGPYVHRIDPIIASVAGVHLWWYGLSYALGFLQMFLFAGRHRAQLGLTMAEVYTLTLTLAVCVLLGGRAVEVLFDEWGFYSQRPGFVPRYWLGGMATHGLLIGAAAGTWLFARVSGKSFLRLADALAVPGAFLMGMQRASDTLSFSTTARRTSR